MQRGEATVPPSPPSKIQKLRRWTPRSRLPRAASPLIISPIALIGAAPVLPRTAPLATARVPARSSAAGPAPITALVPVPVAPVLAPLLIALGASILALPWSTVILNVGGANICSRWGWSIRGTAHGLSLCRSPLNWLMGLTCGGACFSSAGAPRRVLLVQPSGRLRIPEALVLAGPLSGRRGSGACRRASGRSSRPRPRAFARGSARRGSRRRAHPG